MWLLPTPEGSDSHSHLLFLLLLLRFVSSLLRYALVFLILPLLQLLAILRLLVGEFLLLLLILLIHFCVAGVRCGRAFRTWDFARMSVGWPRILISRGLVFLGAR